MRIAINALSVQGGGGETFLRNLLGHLLLIDQKNEYLVFVTQEKKEALKINNNKRNLKTLLCPKRGWFRRGVWEQFVMPHILRREKVDVLYAPGNQGPILFPCPFALLVQNVDPLTRGVNGISPTLELKRRVSRVMMRASVHQATRVVAISEYTRNLLVEEFHYASEGVCVIPHGSPDDTGRMPPNIQVAGRLEKVLKPYFLAVSNVKYNKNYETLVVAHALLCKEISEPIHLLIAGEVEHKASFFRMQELILRHALSSRVHFLGRVDPEALRALYTGSIGLVFPSRVESFGLPPLEAMAYGVPVAASRIAPVIEVCGDAVLYFDPESPREMAMAMLQLLQDNVLKRTLVERGRDRAKAFSWKRSARLTLEILQSVVAT